MKSNSKLSVVTNHYSSTGKSTESNSLGMRPMQERAYQKRGEQYLLIKSPPASGKSRALMYIALDKIHNQKIKKAIIVVPEKSIGSSFNNENLSSSGFFANWEVNPKWNLCNAPGTDGGKVKAVLEFLKSNDQILVTTHSTFRFAIDKFGVDKFDNSLIAVDEFHHVSSNPENKLGFYLGNLIARNRVHIVAMTGSYFRGDSVPVLSPDDESKFETVTYTYYEQLNGYKYLKKLDIGYYFYTGTYSDEILKVLNPNEKTILHIPSVNSRESTKDKIKEVEHIIDALGVWQGTDSKTGFQLVKTHEGKIIKIADLVDDDLSKRDKVIYSLKNPDEKNNKDYVDIIIALGMAKEGFDWIWCEHALTVGYRASLTEVVQIIGRATRDAPGKANARFTNLIAEPESSEQIVTEAVNDTLKAIAASLLMEQVLVPKFIFKPKNSTSNAEEGFEYGDDGYSKKNENVGFNDQTGQISIEINGLVNPKTEEAKKICDNDLNEVIAAFTQDKANLEKGLFDKDLVSEELTKSRMGKIINEKYPQLDSEDQESIRQRAIAAINITQKTKEIINQNNSNNKTEGNIAFVSGVRKFVTDVKDLNIDLIDRINPFGEAYSILSKTMSEERLKNIHNIISSKKFSLSIDEARELAKRGLKFKTETGRIPSINSQDPWEKKMAEGIAFLQRKTFLKDNE